METPGSGESSTTHARIWRRSGLFLDLLGSDATIVSRLHSLAVPQCKKALVTRGAAGQDRVWQFGGSGPSLTMGWLARQHCTHRETAGSEVAGTDRVADDEEHHPTFQGQQPTVGKHSFI